MKENIERLKRTLVFHGFSGCFLREKMKIVGRLCYCLTLINIVILNV